MKKEIEAEIRGELSKGRSHQEVFDDLKVKYHKSGKLLPDILCKIPIAARRKQYNAAWICLLVILGLLTVLRSLSILGLVNPYWIFNGSMRTGTAISIDWFISLGLVVLMCICSYLIYFKVFVKYSVEKVWVTYMDGSKRLEMQGTFKER